MFSTQNEPKNLQHYSGWVVKPDQTKLDSTKPNKGVSQDPWVNCFHHKREKEKKQEKEEGWRERKMEILFWFSSLIFLIFFCLFDETIFISFRCNFCTWVHLACRLLLSCLLIFFFFFWKSWWFVLTKMEILFWFSLFISSLFFFLIRWNYIYFI